MPRSPTTFDAYRAVERFWVYHLDRIKERAERKAIDQASGKNKTNQEK